MTTTEEMEQQHQEDLQRLKAFRLMDDAFLTKCFEDDPKYIQFVLRIVLEMPDLTVIDVRTQVFVENLLNRSVRLDVLATDKDGRKINVEVQRSNQGAGRKRARYNSSMMDAGLVPKGEDFDVLPETYVVFITEHDVMGEGKPVYWIERYFSGSNRKFEDGSYILYVNGAYRDESPIGKLMHDFACTDPAKMHYDELAERVRFFKESKEGTTVMCKILEDLRNESEKRGEERGIKKGIKKGIKEGVVIGVKGEKNKTALRMLKAGKYTLEEIAEMAVLPLDEVKRLQAEREI